ncbi:hypothetical protein [Candidatus Frankia alpina]|uniref:hypothetical protein n=1 Tax=Candidatus Frankia alpina TaxID=2699483 RepID=UPI003AF98941
MAAVPEGDRVVAGRYRLVARLGAGAMGTVWRAFDSVLETEAALKEIEFAGGVAGAERADRVERARRGTPPNFAATRTSSRSSTSSSSTACPGS